jgi:hypothetical protein
MYTVPKAVWKIFKPVNFPSQPRGYCQFSFRNFCSATSKEEVPLAFWGIYLLEFPPNFRVNLLNKLGTLARAPPPPPSLLQDAAHLADESTYALIFILVHEILAYINNGAIVELVMGLPSDQLVRSSKPERIYFHTSEFVENL